MTEGSSQKQEDNMENQLLPDEEINRHCFSTSNETATSGSISIQSPSQPYIAAHYAIAKRKWMDHTSYLKICPVVRMETCMAAK